MKKVERLNEIYALLNQAQKLSEIEYYRTRKFAVDFAKAELAKTNNDFYSSNLTQLIEIVSKIKYNPKINEPKVDLEEDWDYL